MLNRFEYLSSSLIQEVVGKTKNDAELAARVCHPFFDAELELLNEEMRRHFDAQIEESFDEFERLYDKIAGFFEATEKGKVWQRSADKISVDCGWPIVTMDVPELTEKQRKRGLGKKGRIIAERRYRANGRKDCDTEKYCFSYSKCTQRLQRNARLELALDINASFEELVPDQCEWDLVDDTDEQDMDWWSCDDDDFLDDGRLGIFEDFEGWDDDMEDSPADYDDPYEGDYSDYYGDERY